MGSGGREEGYKDLDVIFRTTPIALQYYIYTNKENHS